MRAGESSRCWPPGAGRRRRSAAGAATTYGDVEFPRDEHGHVDGWDFWWGAADLVTKSGNHYIVGRRLRLAPRGRRDRPPDLPAAGPLRGPLDHDAWTGPKEWGHEGAWAGRIVAIPSFHNPLVERAAQSTGRSTPGTGSRTSATGSAPSLDARELPPAHRQRHRLGPPHRRVREGRSSTCTRRWTARRSSPAAPASGGTGSRASSITRRARTSTCRRAKTLQRHARDRAARRLDPAREGRPGAIAHADGPRVRRLARGPLRRARARRGRPSSPHATRSTTTRECRGS